MNRKMLYIFLPVLLAFSLTGCSKIGSKAESISAIYGATAIISLLLFIAYIIFMKKKEKWLYVLFSSILVVETGYFILSVSKALEMALFANALSYLGSVFLPLSMLMIILSVCKLSLPRALPFVLLSVGILVFLLAASPGFCDLYYKQVAIEIVNGVTKLKKVYGPLHIIYLLYLLAYFSSMTSVIIYASVKRKLSVNKQAIVLLMAVFGNILVWLFEQLVDISFEMLSVSYIITELFLIALYLMIQDQEKSESEKIPEIASSEPTQAEITVESHPSQEEFNEEILKYFASAVKALTPKEKLIYDGYISGVTTKELMAELNITENTLKYHNKNIYSKLGVNSRKQLVKYAGLIEKTE